MILEKEPGRDIKHCVPETYLSISKTLAKSREPGVAEGTLTPSHVYWELGQTNVIFRGCFLARTPKQLFLGMLVTR